MSPPDPMLTALWSILNTLMQARRLLMQMVVAQMVLSAATVAGADRTPPTAPSDNWAVARCTLAYVASPAVSIPSTIAKCAWTHGCLPSTELLCHSIYYRHVFLQLSIDSPALVQLCTTNRLLQSLALVVTQFDDDNTCCGGASRLREPLL